MYLIQSSKSFKTLKSFSFFPAEYLQCIKFSSLNNTPELRKLFVTKSKQFIKEISIYVLLYYGRCKLLHCLSFCILITAFHMTI